MAVEAPKILVVDDEGSLRRAITRWLSEQGYDCAGVGSVAEAVAALGAGKVSLILLDLQLPGASGMSLLQGLRKQKVPVPVVIISGTGDMDSAIEAFRVGAADYLRKPFSLDDLSVCVERVLGASVTPQTEDLERSDTERDAPRRAPTRALTRTVTVPGEGGRSHSLLMRAAGLKGRVARAAAKLPLLDPRLAHLRSAVEKHSSVDDVVVLVQRDVALATAVLRTSRSSFYGVREPPTNLRDACVTLGNKRVFSIAFELLVSNQFTVRRPRYRPLFTRMWKNALITARMTARLAELAGGADPDEMHLAAFLHNIGELVLIQYLAEHDDPADAESLDLAALEEESAAVHEDAGTIVAQHWKLAPLLVRLAGYHHRPTRSPEPPQEVTERQLVLAGWTLAQQAGFTYFPSQEDANADGLLAMLDVDPDDYEPLVEQAPDWIDGD